MNISSASSQNSIFGLTNQSNTSRKPLMPSVDPVVSKAEQEKSVNKQANENIVVDQQAIALFEKNQFEANATKSNESSSTFAAAADKDKPSTRNESAVASYQAVGNLAQRESVQQLFGVDIFA
jgi:hypothetical protein